jgi:hypothetical protein
MKKPTRADFEIKALEAEGPRQAEAIKMDLHLTEFQ